MASTEGTPSPAPPAGPGTTAFRAAETRLRKPQDGGAAAEEAPMAVGSRLRIPLTADPLGDAAISSGLTEARAAAVQHLFTGRAQVNTALKEIVSVLHQTMAPPNLVGVLVQPDGSPAGPVQIQFNPRELGDPSPVLTVLTDEGGAFHLT